MWRPPDPLDAVVVWRDQAEHAAESLTKGSRVVVLGKLQQRTWTAEDGSARSTVEVVAEEGEPAVRGSDYQDHAEPGPLASSTRDATGRMAQSTGGGLSLGLVRLGTPPSIGVHQRCLPACRTAPDGDALITVDLVGGRSSVRSRQAAPH